jgi:uncharacterized membrane protein YccC
MSSVSIALSHYEFPPAGWQHPVSFAVRTWLTCILALFIAFFLQLDQPYWAGMTVWILARATPGITLSRSFHRILGTLVGTAMGVVLIALFSQTPELFILALALWIGACTVVANLLRNFRSYSTVLAGYTAAIVSLTAYTSPNTIFDVAMARGAATIVGIICTALSVYLFTRHEAREEVIVHLREAIRACASRAALPIGRSLNDRIALGGPLVAKLIALDTEVEFAAAESAAFRIHADVARSLLVDLFSAISAKRAVEGHLNRAGMVPDPKTLLLHDEVNKLLERAPRQIDGNRWEDLQLAIQTTRAALGGHSPESVPMDPSHIASSRLVLDRLDDLMRYFGSAIASWHAVQGGWKLESSLRLDFHRDQRAAWISGARAFIAVLAAGTFWISSAWSSGSTMLIEVGFVCSLFSTSPQPDITGAAFLRGAVCAAVAAFICNFFLLQSIDGFPLFALALGVCLVPVAMAAIDPRTAGFASSYCVNLMVLSRPLNAMDYDVVSFLNNSMAVVAGVICGVLAYQLFLPPNPTAARRYVVHRIRSGLRALSLRNPIPPAWKWQTRMFDRVYRLYDSANPSGTPTDEWFEGGLAVLHLGNEILRLRQLLEAGKLRDDMSRLLDPVIASFASITSDSHPTLSAIRAADTCLGNTPAPEDCETRRAWFRARAILEEMKAFFVEQPNFLSPA